MTVRGGRLLAWRWGRGSDVVILPGVMEALVKPLALGWLMQRLWKGAARRYRLTLLGCREAVPPGFTTEQMAEDAADALAALGIAPRLTVAMDAGGLVAQWLAARRPRQTGALVLLSAPLEGRAPDAMAQFLEHLCRLLRGDQWPEAFDHAAAVYLEPALREQLRPVLALLRRWGRPPQLQRAVRLLTAYRTHDAREAGPVEVPVLSVAGGMDPLVGLQPPGRGPTADGGRAPWVRPTRQIWLAGEHGAYLRFWKMVMAELQRFEQELAAPARAVPT